MTGPKLNTLTNYCFRSCPRLRGFAKDLSADQLSIFRGFAGNYLKINSILAERSPWTIAHQDYRVENMMFADDDSNRVVVIDCKGLVEAQAFTTFPIS